MVIRVARDLVRVRSARFQADVGHGMGGVRVDKLFSSCLVYHIFYCSFTSTGHRTRVPHPQALRPAPRANGTRERCAGTGSEKQARLLRIESEMPGVVLVGWLGRARCGTRRADEPC